MAKEVPKFTTSVCKRCFKAEIQEGSTGTETLDMIFATHGAGE